jgi:DNA-binding transcriptional MerR regulator
MEGSVPLDKAPDAFRTISEVADELDVPQHVLRFWETRFAQIKPMKRSGGRRYYRRDDVELLRGIRHLLYGQGYTIRGVQRILREQGIKAVQGFSGGIALRHAVPAGEVEAPELEMDDDLLVDEAESDQAFVASPARASEPLMARSSPVPSAATSNGVYPMVAPSPAPPPIVVMRLGDENAGRLRAALSELVECRQLLDRALSAT